MAPTAQVQQKQQVPGNGAAIPAGITPEVWASMGAAGHAALTAALEGQRAAQEALAKAKTGGKITLKVSEKGAVSLYGMGRFPITLYASQWERLFPEIPAVQAFLKANESKLSRKE